MTTFSFSFLPWVIQNRFIEICDASTLAAFIQINSWTRKLSKKRIQIVDDLELSYKMEFKYDYANPLEIKNYLFIYHAPISWLEKNLSYILPSFSRLCILAFELDIKALKYLILGPNLKTFLLMTKLIYETIDEVNEVVNILQVKSFDKFSIYFDKNDPKEKQQLTMAFKLITEKYM